MAAALLSPAATAAQGVPPAPASAPVDPARLTAARSVIDQIFPPATRAQMVQGMMTAMMGNIRQSMSRNPQFASAIESDARVKALFDRFLDRQMTRSNEVMRAGLPGMADAMAHAYARRFTLAQLHDLSVFFASPTGQVYTQASLTIMSDPDVAAWQGGLMNQTMSHLQQDIADFTKEVLPVRPRNGRQ